MWIFAAPCAALPGHIFCLWCDGFIFMLVQKQQLHWFKWQNSQLQLKWQNFVVIKLQKKNSVKGKMCVIFERVCAVWSHSRWSVLLVESAGTNLKEFFPFSFNWFWPILNFSLRLTRNMLLTKWVCQGREGFLKYNCYKTEMNTPCSLNNQL